MSAAIGSAPPDEIDAVVQTWGRAQAEAMRRERRGSLSSELFDIKGRTWVGFECYLDAAPDLLRMLCERTTPEEIGRRMRRPGGRPYYMQLFILMSNYLSAREQRTLDHGVPPDADDERAAADLAVVVEFFARATRAYRSDGGLVPAAPDFDQRILPDGWVARCAELLGPTDRLEEIRRFAAALSLYGFLLHGEQRDGNFDHGPYPLADGTDLLLRELNDLDNRFLPWAERERPLELSNVCIAYAMRDVDMRFSIFSGCVTSPVDFDSRLEAVALFTRDGDEVRPLEGDEMEALAARARELQTTLYRRVVEWPAIERTRYGLHLYANHLAPFFAIAGAEDCLPQLSERFERVGTPAAEAFIAADEPPAIFEYYAGIGEDESAFTPLVTHATQRSTNGST